MSTLKKWYSTEDACKYLGLGRTNLMMLKDNDLTVGVHYVFVTGRKRGTLGWDVAAIQQWQIQASKEIMNRPKKIVEQVETYQKMGV